MALLQIRKLPEKIYFLMKQRFEAEHRSIAQEAIVLLAKGLDTSIAPIMHRARLLQKIEDPISRAEIEAERALSDSVDSGCRFPVGAFAVSDSNSLTLKVAVYSMDGKKSIILEKSDNINNAIELGKSLGGELKDRGVSEIASNWREELEEWNKQ